jgi:NAD(P)-dependent dehydrogenase (short-subunit alcohol dehydrogenase family)
LHRTARAKSQRSITVPCPAAEALFVTGLISARAPPRARREQLRATLPIRRVVRPADVTALALHLMTNTALTGATYDVGGRQLIP